MQTKKVQCTSIKDLGREITRFIKFYIIINIQILSGYNSPNVLKVYRYYVKTKFHGFYFTFFNIFNLIFLMNFTEIIEAPSISTDTLVTDAVLIKFRATFQ